MVKKTQTIEGKHPTFFSLFRSGLVPPIYVSSLREEEKKPSSDAFKINFIIGLKIFVWQCMVVSNNLKCCILIQAVQ